MYATTQNELIEMYGLDGCLLIIGALSLNLIACAGPMRPLHLPGFYLKQKAALEQTEEQPFAQSEKPLATGDPVKTTVATEKGLIVKDLLITVDTKDSLAYNGSFFGSSALVQSIKNKQQAYTTYMYTTSQLLKDRVFLSLCITLFLYSLGAFPPVLFMEDLAQSEGFIVDIRIIPLVSIVAITTGMGKLMLGIMADLKVINSLYLYAFTVAGTGLALLIIPISNSYIGLQILSGVVGFFSGNWSITPYVTTKIVGIEKLTEAYGILMFFGGFGIMLGPPLVGKIFLYVKAT